MLTVPKQLLHIHYMWKTHNNDSNYSKYWGWIIMEKKLRHNCFFPLIFLMPLNNVFGEWDSPVTQDLNWMEKHWTNYILQNVTLYFLLRKKLGLSIIFVFSWIFWKVCGSLSSVEKHTQCYFSICIWAKDSHHAISSVLGQILESWYWVVLDSVCC